MYSFPLNSCARYYKFTPRVIFAKHEANEIINKLINTYIILIGFLPLPASSQVIPEPVADESIYSFLDELAGDGIIRF